MDDNHIIIRSESTVSAQTKSQSTNSRTTTSLRRKSSLNFDLVGEFNSLLSRSSVLDVNHGQDLSFHNTTFPIPIDQQPQSISNENSPSDIPDTTPQRGFFLNLKRSASSLVLGAAFRTGKRPFIESSPGPSKLLQPRSHRPLQRRSVSQSFLSFHTSSPSTSTTLLDGPRPKTRNLHTSKTKTKTKTKTGTKAKTHTFSPFTLTLTPNINPKLPPLPPLKSISPPFTSLASLSCHSPSSPPPPIPTFTPTRRAISNPSLVSSSGSLESAPDSNPIRECVITILAHSSIRGRRRGLHRRRP